MSGEREDSQTDAPSGEQNTSRRVSASGPHADAQDPTAADPNPAASHPADPVTDRSPGSGDADDATERGDADPAGAAYQQLMDLNRRPVPGRPEQPRPVGPDARRVRDARMLDVGRSLAEADSPGAVLRASARLRGALFPLTGQLLFTVTAQSVRVLGEYGYPSEPDHVGGDVHLPMTAVHPVAQVAGTGQPVFLATPGEYRRRFPAAWGVIPHGSLQAWAVLPLRTGGRVTGVWTAAFDQPMGFTGAERTLLEVAALLVGQAVERLHGDERELALSRGLLAGMGAPAPAVNGWTTAARYVPTGGGLLVGGDWYDVIALPDGHLALVIGDVMGHDVHAAALMSRLRTAVHAYATEGHAPDAVLARASRFLASIDADRFATCLYLDADPRSGQVRLARAGHPHPVLRLPDGTCLLKHVRGGLPLGLAPQDDDYPVDALTLNPDDVLMLCTDGLIENGGHDMYTGWDRVRGALAPAPADDLEGMADNLLATVGEPPPPDVIHRPPPHDGDDVALLLLRRDADGQPPAAPRRSLVLTVRQDSGTGLADARAQLRDLLHDWRSADQVDVAVLLASELLGNVLVHTEHSAGFTAAVTGLAPHRCLYAQVVDGSDDLPHRRAPGELASSGRGLLLLDVLAQRWSVRPRQEGKAVWFELDETTPEEPAIDHSGPHSDSDAPAED